MFVLCRASTAGCYMWRIGYPSHIKPQHCLFHNVFISCLNNRSLSRLCWWKMQNSGRKDPNWGWFHHRFSSVSKQKQIRLLPDWKGLGKLDFDSGRGFFFIFFCKNWRNRFIYCVWLIACFCFSFTFSLYFTFCLLFYAIIVSFFLLVSIMQTSFIPDINLNLYLAG